MNVFLWGVLPYVMMAILVGGLIWRYRYDQFGWTTRSSQLYESRLLRIGSPLFFPPLVMGATYNEAAHSYTIGLVLLTITASGALLFTLFGIRRKTSATA